MPPVSRGDTVEQSHLFEALEQRAQAEFDDPDALDWSRLVERRYKGQGETLVSTPEVDFHQLHQERFGFSRHRHPVETVQLRLRARRAPLEGLKMPSPSGGEPEASSATVRWNNSAIEVAVYSEPPKKFAGPALVLQSGSTLFVAPGWNAESTQRGHLRLRR